MFHPPNPIVMDANAGAKKMEHMMFMRRGEGSSPQRSKPRIVRAGSGRRMGGGDLFG